jgi:4-hydroxy-3-methylbut-2-en-1-yl diphosphate reductase
VSGLAVLSPMRVEAAAIRRGMPAGARVSVAGMGRKASAELTDADQAVAIAGVAGALARDVRPGDVVVATEVRGPDDTSYPCPSAPLLAGELRRHGLRVHIGPVVTSDHLVTGRAREALAGQGALCVDMESSRLAAAAGDRPLAVIRTIVDTSDHPLVRVGTIRRGWDALRALRRSGPALAHWAAAVAARDVLLAAPASFCAGVERAIAAVLDAIEEHGAPVYVRRQIVHNAHVVRDLEQRGAIFVEELDEVPVGSLTVFSAHGVAPAIWTQAKNRDLMVVDATCPLVAKVHAEVRRFNDSDDLLVYVGHEGHDETEGTLGEATSRLHVIDSAAAVADLPDAAGQTVRYVTQTTLSVQETERIVSALRQRFPDVQGPARRDICFATTNRQEALAEVAADADLVLVVGSSNSSNSLRLVELAEAAGVTAHLVDEAADVQLGWLIGCRSVGLSAGASAPPKLLDELAAAISGLSPSHDDRRITTRRVSTENVTFAPPRKVDLS